MSIGHYALNTHFYTPGEGGILFECRTTRPADNSDRDKSARKRVLVGPYVKTTRTVLLFYNIVKYLCV